MNNNNNNNSVQNCEINKNSESVRINNSIIFESIFNYTSDAVIVLDLNNHIILVNEAFENVYGWKREEVIGKKIYFTPEYLREEAAENRRRIENGEIVATHETTRLRKDGSSVQVSLSISPIRDKNGKIIGKAGVSRDITNRKKMEEQLREISARHKMITENILDVITILDRNERIIYASPSFEKLFGYAIDEKIDSFRHIHPDDVKKIQNTFSKIMQSRTPATNEIRAINKNGEIIIIEAQGMPVIGDKGEVEYVVVSSRDITEKKKTEELLRNSDKIVMVGELAASIAHEIRNPLTSLIGFIQLFQRTGTASQEHLAIMTSELDRINMIVSELLLLAKPQVTNFKLIDVQKVLEDVLSLMQSQANMSNTRFNIQWQAESTQVYAEANHLKQVFINILKNGIESMPQGGELTIMTKLVEGRKIRVRIQDEGSGIPESILAKLGEPFFTTKESGTGLGLMISKKIIQDHHGELIIDSILEKGTTVDIALPLPTDLLL